MNTQCPPQLITALLWRFRSLVSVAAAFLLVDQSHAQKQPELDYLIRYTTPIDPVQEKYIHEALQAHEAGAQVWLDSSDQEVKVRTHVPLEREDLEAVWAPIGLQVIYLERWWPDQPGALRSHEGSLPTSFPYYIDTGDTVADEANYQAAKVAWIAAHCKEYETIAPPSAPATTTPQR